MKRALKALAVVVVLLSVSAYADETVSRFSFKTIEGKTIEYRASDKSPLVINIGAHW